MSTSLVNKEAVALQVLGGPTETQPLLRGQKKNCECSTRAKVCSVALLVLAVLAAGVLVAVLAQCHAGETGSVPPSGMNSTSWLNLTKACANSHWPHVVP